MSDKGIIFSAPMVRALLAGRKTQTRRLLGGAPSSGAWHCDPDRSVPSGRKFVADGGGVSLPCKVPYATGDRLYVREAHALVPASAYRASEGVQQLLNPADQYEACIYALDWERSKPRWRPSIHMPRWASRLWLAVTDVRVQCLQDCSEADAIAEGIDGFACIGGNAWRDYSGGDGFNRLDRNSPAKRSYGTLWNSLHADEATTWEANPWVVAVTFDVRQGNIDTDI